MATTITIDPATRLEGHLKVQVESNAGQVTSARSSGMMFRGFENLLIGKDPRDAAHITQRICGVCPTNHAMASCLAMEAAAGFAAPGQRAHHPQPDPRRGLRAVAHPALLPPGGAQLHPRSGHAALDASLRRGPAVQRRADAACSSTTTSRRWPCAGRPTRWAPSSPASCRTPSPTSSAASPRSHADAHRPLSRLPGPHHSPSSTATTRPTWTFWARSIPTTTPSAAATATCSPLASST